MNPDRPIYGLSHVYHAEFFDVKPDSIEQLAAQYLAEIRQVQPVGPYHFCGFSAGGLIAFEMARQLRVAGEETGSLVLVEPTVLSRSSWANRVAETMTASDSVMSNIRQLLLRAPKSIRSRTRLYLEKAVARSYFLTRKPLPENLRWIGYLESLEPAMLKYEYMPVDCRGTLLYRWMDSEYCESAKAYWSTLFQRGAEVVVFPDAQRHEDFMLEPAFSQTVKILDRIST